MHLIFTFLSLIRNPHQFQMQDLKQIEDNAHEFTRREVLPDRCFESVYMVTLLRDGFGFELDSRDITFTFLVDGSEVDWSIGMAISHFAEDHMHASSMKNVVAGGLPFWSPFDVFKVFTW